MLSALELAGFKSFADKTRFDFPDGITVIVGPNGSGKSNVVDAIKWVLGAQSAKALRGKDMIDVIFKGSSATGRKPSNSAEATLVFDNSKKLLGVDAEEVHVTRRVYRSGEGEYLINGQACRLRDIKDLFRGTGVGVDAYSLIEQGKVDRMLQASPKDRRVIFEEAAGISRFNAKKAEAARRLDRVDQNLCRLKDIVDEVHTRLSALKSQASKAQRYREMTSRMHELRLRLGWTEYSTLRQNTATAEAAVEQLTQEHDRWQAEVEQARHRAQHSEQALHGVAQRCQQVEASLQDSLQSIAVSQNQQLSLRQRIEENHSEQMRQAARLAALRNRAHSLQSEIASVSSQAETAQHSYDAAKRRADTASAQVLQLRQQHASRSSTHATRRQEHVALLRELSAAAATAAQHKNAFSDLLQAIAATEQQIAEQGQARRAVRQSAEQAQQRLQQMLERNSTTTAELARQQQELDQHRRLLDAKRGEAAVLQGRLEGASERLSILEQLEQHLEGVDAGARHLIELARNSSDPALQSVRGLVAELLEVDVDIAPLIDTALGPMSNALVINDGQLIQRFRSQQLEVPGRLTLLRLDRLPTRRFGEKIQLDGVRGIIGRADRLVDCQADVTPLMRYLLATTWLVESLDVALDLGHFRGASLRFVTADCQLVDADGTLTIGGLQSSAGLVSRRSEIQNTKFEIADTKVQHQRAQAEIGRLDDQTSQLAPRVHELEQQAKDQEKELAHQQAATQAAVGRLEEAEQLSSRLDVSLRELQAKRSALEPDIAAWTRQVEAIQSQIAHIEQELNEHESVLQTHDSNIAAASEEQTAARIELARAEQKLEAVNASLQQSTRNQQERRQAVDEAQQELKRLRHKAAASELEILQLTESLAEEYLRSEVEDANLEGLAVEASELRKARSAAVKHLDTISRTIDKLASQCQATQLELERFREASQALLKRYSEDYAIELEQLSQAEKIEDPAERSALDKEAARLRQDIASVGEINMAALAELDELQSRYDFLHGQYEDLMAAKESLQRIIQKINTDSRRMFMETLEIIRVNFQKLYRKSFGGGNADIVLEAGEDVLECGIDIVATPPGKTALSNSLLSGGEKALTAVALLLAIFQYRPSPFCVLDEVDAPFDEANIGRFVNVLTEFLDWTKFIIVTHSKKTMTASTTLYGVTMQESGVSKQVAVRFEDVNEKGEIIKGDSQSSRHAA
ncbi:MAG: chromosome segregation protein SMC [Planctomycetales bacterium]|nr:chromosome segregation protein SMC [Planctomycetales bacterium]